MSQVRLVLLFFVATFALSWTCQTPAILALRAGTQPGAALLLLMVIGASGPTLVAIAISAVRGGRAGVRGLLRPPGTGAWQLLLIAVAFPTVAHLTSSAVLWVTGSYSASHILYPPLRPEQIAIAILAPLGEEYGWRGFAQRHLQSPLTPLAASLVIGLAWALWHIPTLFMPEARGTSALELALYLVAYLASSIIYTWLYNATGRSMRAPLLAHLGAHLDNVFRASSMGDGIAPLFGTAAVLTLMAAVVVWKMRAGLGANQLDAGPAHGRTC
jgi:membrane protease YdiL (CAAX protease family)